MKVLGRYFKPNVTQNVHFLIPTTHLHSHSDANTDTDTHSIPIVPFTHIFRGKLGLDMKEKTSMNT